jgi:hypothetical protein
MAITENELKNLIALRVDIEKITSISSDGKDLLTRIPKSVCEFLELKKTEKIRWLVDTDKKIKLEIIR